MPAVLTSPILMAILPILSISTNAMDNFVNMAYTMLVAIGLNLVILFALPLAIIGAFVALAVIGHATNIIPGLAVSLQATVLPITVIAVGIWIA
jgi:hypothetical protein